MGPRAETDVALSTDSRRRRTAAAVAALAALAAAIPLVWWSTRGPGSVAGPPASSLTTSAATPSSTATSATIPAVAPTGDADAPARTVTVDPEVPLVARPDLPYLLDTTLYRGATTRSFPVKPVFTYIPLAESRALLLDEFHGYEWDRLQLLDASGRIVLTSVAPPDRSLGAVANGAGTQLAMIGSPATGARDQVLILYDSDGTERLRKTAVLGTLRLEGIVGDRAFLRDAGRTGGTYAWDLRDNTVNRYAEWDIASVNEASGRGALVERREFGEPRCTLVADVRGPKPLPVSTTCGLFVPMELSPDGRYLLGVSAAPNDPPFLGAPRVIDTETGRAVLTFEEPTDVVTWTAFLADGSVGLNLLPHPDLDADAIRRLTEAPTWWNTLVRCTVDGDCTRMAETIPAGSGDEGARSRYQLVRD